MSEKRRLAALETEVDCLRKRLNDLDDSYTRLLAMMSSNSEEEFLTKCRRLGVEPRLPSETDDALKH